MPNGKKNGNGGAVFKTPQNRRTPDHLPPVATRFKPGQSGNPGGRPKLLKAAYKAWLEQPNETHPEFTNSEVIAVVLGKKALRGDLNVARELRTATEGDRITVVWQSEFVLLVQQGVLTPQEVIEELGPEEARAILIAAGGGIPSMGAEIKTIEQPIELEQE